MHHSCGGLIADACCNSEFGGLWWNLPHKIWEKMRFWKYYRTKCTKGGFIVMVCHLITVTPCRWLIRNEVCHAMQYILIYWYMLLHISLHFVTKCAFAKAWWCWLLKHKHLFSKMISWNAPNSNITPVPA